jgi:hypothetical protein
LSSPKIGFNIVTDENRPVVTTGENAGQLPEKRRFAIFWIPWSIDAIVAAIFVYFFFLGIGDGSVSSFNIVLWLGILIGLAIVLGGSLALRAAGRPGLATALVTALAVPSVLIGLLFLALFFAPMH